MGWVVFGLAMVAVGCVGNVVGYGFYVWSLWVVKQRYGGEKRERLDYIILMSCIIK